MIKYCINNYYDCDVLTGFNNTLLLIKPILAFQEWKGGIGSGRFCNRYCLEGRRPDWNVGTSREFSQDRARAGKGQQVAEQRSSAAQGLRSGREKKASSRTSSQNGPVEATVKEDRRIGVAMPYCVVCSAGVSYPRHRRRSIFKQFNL
jgi:hypothetical protein